MNTVMASLDTLLQHMSALNASGAFLRGDSPIQLQTARGPQQMNAVPNAQLERDIREIAPPDALAALDSTGNAQFSYGGANFSAQNLGGFWQLQIAPLVAYHAAATQLNSSGQGAASVVPPEIRGWNWGAFFLPWIWGIGNNAFVGLLALVPCVGFFARFLMGAKGSEWSWQKRKWNSLADFQNAQKTWAIVGAIIFIGGNVVALPITAAILFPVFARARENARRASCQSNLKQIGLATVQFANANTEHYPKGTTFSQWAPQLEKYLGSKSVFHCPSDNGAGASYQLNPHLSGVGLETIGDVSSTPLMWDKDGINHLDGRDVLFADGHVKWFREQQFKSEVLPQAK